MLLFTRESGWDDSQQTLLCGWWGLLLCYLLIIVITERPLYSIDLNPTNTVNDWLLTPGTSQSSAIRLSINYFVFFYTNMLEWEVSYCTDTSTGLKINESTRAVKLINEQLKCRSWWHFAQKITKLKSFAVVGGVSWMKHLLSSDLDMQVSSRLRCPCTERQTNRLCLLCST